MRIEVEKIVVDCIVEIQNEVEPTDALYFMKNYFEFDLMKVMQELIRYLVAVMNSTQLWILKGNR